jgi:hypothetical protein
MHCLLDAAGVKVVPIDRAVARRAARLRAEHTSLRLPRQLRFVFMVASRRATAPAPVVAGMSDRASALAAQRAWEPEAGQDGGVEELRDRGDPFAVEG